MGIASEKTAELARGMVKQVDDKIFQAITGQIGPDWSLGIIETRVVRKIMPDKTEIISLDGVDLLRIFPLELSSERTEIGMTMRATQNIQRLTSP